MHLRFNDGRIGVVWRYSDPGNHYRFVMDPQAGCAELIRISGGGSTVLATKSFTHTPGQAYAISVEAVGPLMRVYQDGGLVFM